MFNRHLLIIVVLIVLVFVILYYYLASFDYSKTKLEFETGSELDAYVVDNFKKQTIGLSGFDKLNYNQAMLFSYPDEQVRSIWMKKMSFPIDVIWLNKNKEIINITLEIPADSYPKKFSSKKPVKYFVEVNAGWVEKNNIKIGQNVTFWTE